MRNGILDNEEKARACLTRLGRTGNSCAKLDQQAIDELAAVYDECVAPEESLPEKVKTVTDAHAKRLEAAKESHADIKHLFRNKQPSPIEQPSE